MTVISTSTDPVRSPRHRIAKAFEPCFALILQIRSAEQMEEVASFRETARDLLDASERTAREAGNTDAQIQESLFAIVAFFDETIQESEWADKEQWRSRPLQLERFGRYDAGEEFFVRLEALRADPVEQAAVLEVYYLCLALGYRGRYQVKDCATVQALMETLQADLSAAPSATGQLPARPDDRPASPPRVVRVAPLHIAMAAVVLISGIYLAAGSSAARTADRTSEVLVGMIEERPRTLAPDQAPDGSDERAGSAVEAAAQPAPAGPRSSRPSAAGPSGAP
jgi:type VI secretion system protein ImpK